MLSGKHYNRSISCHKVMYEALQRLRFEAFLETLNDESRERIYSLIVEMENSFLEDKLHDCIESQEFEDLFIQYETFIAESSAKSKTFAYWSMYIQMAGKANEIVLKGTVKLT